MTQSQKSVTDIRIESIEKMLREYAKTGSYPTAVTDLQHLLEIVREERSRSAAFEVGTITLGKKIVELEADNRGLKDELKMAHEVVQNRDERINALESALQPFAEEYRHGMDGNNLKPKRATWNDFAKAHALLAGPSAAPTHPDNSAAIIVANLNPVAPKVAESDLIKAAKNVVGLMNDDDCYYCGEIPEIHIPEDAKDVWDLHDDDCPFRILARQLPATPDEGRVRE